MATARERPSPDSLLRHLSKGKTWREQLDRPVPVSCSPRALAKRLFCLQFSQAESPPGGTVGGGGGGHSSAAELSAFYRWEKKRAHIAWCNIWVSNLLLAAEACGSLSGGRERTERARGRRMEGGNLYPKPGVVGGRGEWEGGAAFQRGMMEVFVIERRDEMSRVGTDGATDEGQSGADTATGASEKRGRGRESVPGA